MKIKALVLIVCVSICSISYADTTSAITNTVINMIQAGNSRDGAPQNFVVAPAYLPVLAPAIKKDPKLAKYGVTEMDIDGNLYLLATASSELYYDGDEDIAQEEAFTEAQALLAKHLNEFDGVTSSTSSKDTSQSITKSAGGVVAVIIESFNSSKQTAAAAVLKGLETAASWYNEKGNKFYITIAYNHNKAMQLTNQAHKKAMQRINNARVEKEAATRPVKNRVTTNVEVNTTASNVKTTVDDEGNVVILKQADEDKVGASYTNSKFKQ